MSANMPSTPEAFEAKVDTLIALLTPKPSLVSRVEAAVKSDFVKVKLAWPHVVSLLASGAAVVGTFWHAIVAVL